MQANQQPAPVPDVDEARSADPLKRVWQELSALGLEPYVADLAMHGFTIIPPSIASPNGLADRLLAAVLEVAERRRGVRPDLVTGATHAGFGGRYAARNGDSPFGDLLHTLILEGPVFEEALMNPVLLAMTTYLCGYSVVLSSMGAFLKGPNKTCFDLHCDTLLPSPLPHQALVCNATYVLTEFNRENGSTAFLPGSHRWCRGPGPGEAEVGEGGNADVIAVEAEPGALVVWHGNTWHGAFNRRAPGLRVSIPVLMARPFMRTEEDLFGHVPDAALRRNSQRFAYLAQQGIVYGFHSDESAKTRVTQATRRIKAYDKEIGGVVSMEPLRMHLYG